LDHAFPPTGAAYRICADPRRRPDEIGPRDRVGPEP